MLIDTHSHLNLYDYNDDIEEVIQRSVRNNVTKIIVVGMDEISNKKAIKIAEKFNNIKIAVGIHPCYHHGQNYEKLEKYLNNANVIAVGETGLDLYHRKDDLIIQKIFFQKQIELSIKYNLPLILHARNSFKEVYEMLSFYKGSVKGVFHCLVSSLEEAKKALSLGFYVGIGGIVTYPKALEAHKIAKIIPLEKILLETDCPYLTPEPFRHKRNEPSNIKIIAEKISQIRGISLNDVAFQTSLNACKLFNLK